jgi:hypothetical protein
MILSLFLYGQACGTGVTDLKERSFTMQQDIISYTKEEAEQDTNARLSFSRKISGIRPTVLPLITQRLPEKWRKEYAELRERYDLDTIRINKLSDEIRAVERIMRGDKEKEKDWGER